ncbi:DNA methyltransferase [Pediococcus inopinatus]|nr:DNA methyltransferase [Pediococcus inopinatus]
MAPNQKPVALFEYLINTYTLPGQVVLNNCMGSATTAIACINTDRH